MPRQTHKDFYKRLEQLETRIDPRLLEEQKARKELYAAGSGSTRTVALNKYRRAVNATFRATDRRRKFLEKYQP
jgi:hypothetical protein